MSTDGNVVISGDASRTSGKENSQRSIEISNLRSAKKSIRQEKCNSPLSCFYWALTRKKPLDRRTETNLNRCLGLIDLTTLGVGSTLGLGLYVLAGNVASTKAGPAVIISFAFAALASAFSALCYAEFAGLVPRAGSAYVYTYITVGEFPAFFIGWNLLLEYAIGAAAVTRGFTDHLRTLYRHLAKESRHSTFEHLHVDNQSCTNPLHGAITLDNSSQTLLGCQLSEKGASAVSFDGIPFIIVAIITIPIAIGAKCSTRVTFLFTAVNLMVVGCVLVSGFMAVDGFKNWQLPAETVKGYGTGGFMPYGWAGVFTGASTCFFGFIGFDTIASSAEEAKNPKRNVPLSIIFSLIISSLAYMSIATVQTLVWPYHDQQCDTVLPYIFNSLNMPTTYWIVTVGAIAGLASSQLAGMIPLPRTLYSMANDRLIYSFLSKISKRYKIPLRAVVVGSVLVAPLAATVDTETLANMVSIGTLAAYTVVSLSVLILRYEQHQECVDDQSIVQNHLNFVEIIDSLNSLEKDAPRSMAAINMNHLGTDSDPNNPKFTSEEAELKLKLKRARLLKPQLSIGFQSWFKSTSSSENPDVSRTRDNMITIPEGQPELSSPKEMADDEKLSPKIVPMSKLIYELLTVDPRSPRTEKSPTDQTSKLSKILITILVILCTAFDIIAYIYINSKPDNGDGQTPILTTSGMVISSGQINLIAGACIVVVLMATTLLLLTRLPKNSRLDEDSFRVPFLPFIPMLSILVNVYLMFSLDMLVWIRFLAWMAIGFFIYFSYGIWESVGFMISNIDQH